MPEAIARISCLMPEMTPDGAYSVCRLAGFASVLGMGKRENLQDLLRQAKECEEILEAARNKRDDSEQPVELTASEFNKVWTVFRDVAGSLSWNLDLIAPPGGE